MPARNAPCRSRHDFCQAATSTGAPSFSSLQVALGVDAASDGAGQTIGSHAGLLTSVSRCAAS
jgi:hypothetical protein